MAIVGHLLFFLAGLCFGFAAPGRYKWLPLIFSVVLAVGAAARNGIDAALILRLLVALVVTAIGVILGRMLEERGRRHEATAA
jgi:hypothetical protein